METIGGPEYPPKGMEWLDQYRPVEDNVEVYSACSHGRNAVGYISSVVLLRIKDNGMRVVQCRICGKMWDR